MALARLALRLASLQAPNGAFKSRIVYRDHEEEDLNGFITALVLRHLRGLPKLPDFKEQRDQALDFLECCASSRLPGAFGFWPADQRPAWSRGIPEDADDTAVINLELGMHGRRSRQQVGRVVSEVLVPALVTEVDRPGPPWIHPVVFPTWLGEPRARNLVDCCVNVNVAVLMSWCGLSHFPGYREACALVQGGLDWASEDWERLRTLAPYYPNPVELCHALEHAVACGVTELEPARFRLRNLLSRQAFILEKPNPRLQLAVCGNAYGGPFWLSTALEVVREAMRDL